MIDNNLKKFIPQFAIITKFFHCEFANPCMIFNQRRSRSGVCITAQLTIRCQLVRYGAVTLKGSQRIGDGWIFLKTLRAFLFNNDLSNEPNFSRIYISLDSGFNSSKYSLSITLKIFFIKILVLKKT